MGSIKFLTAILQLIKDPKAAGGMGGAALLVFASYYMLTEKVDAKHAEAMAQINENKKSVTKMVEKQTEILVTLRAINESVKETKAQVKDTRDKVWQIGRDVYILRTKPK